MDVAVVDGVVAGAVVSEANFNLSPSLFQAGTRAVVVSVMLEVAKDYEGSES